MRLQRCLFFHAALAVLFVTILAGTAAAQNQGRISGIILDENGKPIKAATVTAENPDTNQTLAATTDEKGRFTIIGLRPGIWKFLAQAPGYFPDEGQTPIRVGTPNGPIAFALKKSGAPGGGALGSVSAKDLQTQLSAADSLFNLGRWDDAVTAYRAIMERTPALSSINLQIGAAYTNKKDYDLAVTAYNDLLKIDPNNQKAIVGIARAKLEKGDPAAAEAALMKGADGPSAGREVLIDLGDLKFNAGDTDAAMTWYQKAAVADPSWGKAWYKLGLAAQKKGDKAGAAEFLNKVLVVDPESPEAAMAKSTLDQLNR